MPRFYTGSPEREFTRLYFRSRLEAKRKKRGRFKSPPTVRNVQRIRFLRASRVNQPGVPDQVECISAASRRVISRGFDVCAR